MSLGYFVMGVAGISGITVAACGAMTLAARVTARLLGVAGFRWFDAQPAPAVWWKRLCVRAAATLAPFVLGALLFCAGLLANGELTRTGGVEVDAGPARDAGMLDGDRIVRVGARRVGSWDEMRNAVQGLDGAATIEVERRGSKVELLVSPRRGRIGVTPQFRMEPVGVFAALARGFALPWTTLGASARSLVPATPGGSEPEMQSPVRIVREVGASKESVSIASYLALLLTYLSPWLAGVSLFDALTLAVFQAQHPQAQSSGGRVYRLQRLSIYVAAMAGGLVDDLRGGRESS